ncbi:hypothetical protein ERO13_A05G370400v2 [Gossypium hirsutum]|uniref:Probable WRKY transcription factor protein 1 n=1 Tax=Gossypium hirsutum TaxID=3635 RepID=A0ABM3BT80_GOSHI|nr:probable WRKY transcription factor protein 1 [Gossypium hirsutum]XP_040970253.1 probable WRKY transcription factor protein 1 [Gossypium hirsutum]KAG4202950.1 hypothetical protein ERO13_A05G370400v2 [Gossypium hirsutum]KAG4202951.1 hypothetical protein ERO13_A05G370400v2 [Gossypium hirsutum]KAG4202952.1 hypothetical protein ERO13_A05G370400v2 [Gossypium hirsutum]KAG4202953.1 hypothetical protein ERO13_A05G370400v2 [Gossypium hirsutum]KAG4202954.1 hypothetical protein ERO13_A05G370400v2 [Gos
MAEESIGSPVTLDISGSDGGNSRRNSLAVADSVSSREKTLPRYLRASTGSCHDFCKYGKKHESEEIARHPFRKRIVEKLCDEPNLFRSLDLVQRKQTSTSESKSFPNFRSHTPDMPDTIKLQLPTCSPDGNNSRIHGVQLKKEKTSAAKLKSKHPPNSRSRHKSSDVVTPEVSTNSSNSQIPRNDEVLLEEKKTSIAKLRSSPNLKSHSSDASKVVQKGGSTSSKKVGVSSKEVSSKPNDKNFSKALSTSSKPKSQVEKLPLASVPSGASSVKRNSGSSDTKMRKRTVTSKVAVKKALASPRASLSPRASPARATSLTARKNLNLKVVPLKKNQNKVEKAESEQPPDEQKVRNNDALEEKTLYVIKMETENMLLESDKNENCAAELPPPVASSPKSSSLTMSPPLSSHGGRDEDESEYTEDDSDSEYYEDDEDETVNTEEVEHLERENGGRSRKGRMVFSEEKDSRPVKLSFRRGKVVDIQTENNGPRRLKFRRGRLLGVNQNIKAERRTFRTREVDGDMNDNEPCGEKVVLRHQDLQGKKDEKGLFNNVIEETASKLVETRKSKVKALVGAFETVISLQDGKPSSNTVT